MTTERKKTPTITFPVGILKWPKLNEPDYGTDKFPIPEGRFSTKMIYDAEAPATKKLIATLSALHAEAVAEGQVAFAKLPVGVRKKIGQLKVDDFFTTIYDKETEEPTGQIEFTVKRKFSGTDKKTGKKWTAVLPIFDGMGNRIKNPPVIYGGSKARVTVQVRPYFVEGTGAAGITLSLEGVQIAQLVTKGDRSAESLGFGVLEGGYTYDEQDAIPDDIAEASAPAAEVEDSTEF